MQSLNEELDILRELDKHRDRAKELRKQGVRPLRAIKDIDRNASEQVQFNSTIKYDGKADPRVGQFDYSSWDSAGNTVEIALLTKVQNHRDLCDHDDENNTAHATEELKRHLTSIRLGEDLMPGDVQESYLIDRYRSVPVIAAARIMQVLTSRSETVFSRASMISYYRIIRELYGTAAPDWTAGAARAGTGGKTSAFVTGECMRAIFNFRDTISRTAVFFRQTDKLLRRFDRLRLMLGSLGPDVQPNHPLHVWADNAMQAMWLDWYLSTNQRHGQIALYVNDTGKTKEWKKTFRLDEAARFDAINWTSRNDPNRLYQFHLNDEGAETKVRVSDVSVYFEGFIGTLAQSLREALAQVECALQEISEYRKEEEEKFNQAFGKTDRQSRNDRQKFERTFSSHTFAENRIAAIRDELLKAYESVSETAEVMEGEAAEPVLDGAIRRLKEILNDIAKSCEINASGLNRIAAPTRQYIKGVIRRELANPESSFDAGELVFAASTFGSMTDWKQHELLNRACSKLVDTLPETGRYLTVRPLHTSVRGYRMLPIGCEMTRSLAFLLDKMKFEFNSQLVARMLNIFEDKLIPLYRESDEKNKYVAWNYDNAPEPDTPCVWVTAVSVLALDQIVRMLDARINRAVLKHFETVLPEKPHIESTIPDLIFADDGFNQYYYRQFPEDYPRACSIPIQLELMRAHVMRACLPRFYTEPLPGSDRRTDYSAILYGPPGTGKTTLAEVLAYNSGQALIKLSPSDLNVTGESLIEGRARDVFEALSMLTQTVIIFDEFEPMVQSRQLKTNSTEHTPDDRTQSTDRLLESIANEVKGLRQKDDPKLRFLLGGMLPKFLKLHDAAKTQSLVYFGGTNVLKDIDIAARRPGRFDLKIPIYHPCPLSRAGSLMYRLAKTDSARQLQLFQNGDQVRCLLTVVMTSANEPASELAQAYFNKSRCDNINIILNGNSSNFVYRPDPSRNPSPIEKMIDYVLTNAENLEDIELREYFWLICFEQHFAERAGNYKPGDNMQVIADALQPSNCAQALDRRSMLSQLQSARAG